MRQPLRRASRRPRRARGAGAFPRERRCRRAGQTRSPGGKNVPVAVPWSRPFADRSVRRARIAREAERERATARLLFEAPWLGFAGTAALVEDLRQHEYESIRRRLLSRWWDRLRRVRLDRERLSRDGARAADRELLRVLKSDLQPERAHDPRRAQRARRRAARTSYTKR